MNNKPVYIMSLEASDIYNHMNRGMYIKKKFNGMLPFSLELIKLKEVGLRTNYIKSRDKFISEDIINVKFDSTVKSADEMIKLVEKKINLESDDSYQLSLMEFKELLEHHSSISEGEDIWNKISIPELRKNLYLNGFTLNYTTKDNKQKSINYVVYKRSSAKSRNGQCLFIKESLYKKMIKWSRMYLPFKDKQKVDLASLLAYESLVGSALESTIKLNPHRILMVSDIDSKFNYKANIVKKDTKTGMLNSFYDKDAEISNSIFDGESLLDAKYFENGKSMMLLRNHMFKSASFSCNIQSFLMDNKPKDVPYSDWCLVDMFGNNIKAIDVDMICTPSSLKAFKFSNILPSKTENEMWNYWKELIVTEGMVFGVCKNEKPTKIGYKNTTLPLQQTSYQMINCLPASKNDISALISIEDEYIMKLKNDNEFLISEIYNDRDETNSNEVIKFLYDYNKDIVNTDLFKRFKKNYIYKKSKHAKKGKIKVEGDYCVMLGNPIELLYHSIGEFNIEHFKPTLSDNEVCCNLFKDNELLTGFRNPNTSPSNVLLVKNRLNSDVLKYLNLSNNIVVVNAIKFPIQDRLSGCDYDSDTVLLSNNKTLLDLAKICNKYYNVCLNYIEGNKKQYRLSKYDHFEIDNQLSKSQKNIGRVVNLGQFCMSVYWDIINSKKKVKNIDELLKKVDVMTILSGIAIDMAKKFYDIDIDSEIKFVEENELLSKYKKKPLFWVTVSTNTNIKNNVQYYRCPMDYLIELLDSTENATRNNEKVDFSELINEIKVKNINTKQIDKVSELLDVYLNNLKLTNAQGGEALRDSILEVESDVVTKLKTWKLKSDTIALILKKMSDSSNEKLLKILKLLHETHVDELKKALK